MTGQHEADWPFLLWRRRAGRRLALAFILPLFAAAVSAQDAGRAFLKGPCLQAPATGTMTPVYSSSAETGGLRLPPKKFKTFGAHPDKVTFITCYLTAKLFAGKRPLAAIRF